MWDGCHPYEAVPVQFSCHRPAPDGTIAHHEWLADGSGDPRPVLARALVAACRGARTVVAYNAGFERGCIERLADAVPELADDLLAIAARLADPLPVVRAHVYHPDFHGSFSLKSVLPALVQGPASEINDSAPGGRAPHLASVGRAPRPPCDGVPHDPNVGAGPVPDTAYPPPSDVGAGPAPARAGMATPATGGTTNQPRSNSPYAGLEVAEGATAAMELERLLFRGDSMTAAERAHLRDALLRYCAVDTMSMVRLLDKLRALA